MAHVPALIAIASYHSFRVAVWVETGQARPTGVIFCSLRSLSRRSRNKKTFTNQTHNSFCFCLFKGNHATAILSEVDYASKHRVDLAVDSPWWFSSFVGSMVTMLIIFHIYSEWRISKTRFWVLDRKDNSTFTPRGHPNCYWSEVLTGVFRIFASDWELIEQIEREIASARRYWICHFISFREKEKRKL